MKCQCGGMMLCSDCHLTTCDCEASSTYCDSCKHKLCRWCGNSTLSRSEECEECSHWDCVGDLCDIDFCVLYLNGQGYIKNNLKCHMCHSTLPMIRVPLAFALPLQQILIEYPHFEKIKPKFLKYYSYSHTSGIWEPHPHLEFRVAQDYFDFDGGVIVLGRSRDDENKAKLKEEKMAKKLLKKERRAAVVNNRLNQILSI